MHIAHRYHFTSRAVDRTETTGSADTGQRRTAERSNDVEAWFHHDASGPVDHSRGQAETFLVADLDDG